MAATTQGSEIVPRMREGIDITKAGLTVEEGFLASRVDGRATIHQIAQMMGKPTAEVERLLRRLASAGLVRLGEGGEEETERPAAPQERVPLDYGDYIFPPGLIHEECDLNQAERKRIIFFHEHLETWTHYELLQVRRRSDEKEIKRAYYSRSKEWHPDRFRRPKLGSYKRMIDRIFKQVQDAYSVLSEPKTRANYDEQIVFMAGEDEIAELLAVERKKERDARRVEEADQRRKKKNPLRRRIQQARELFDQALALREKGEVLEALRAAQTAEAFDQREEYSALVETLKGAAGEHRIGPLMRRGSANENMTNWHEAVEAFEEAVRLAPEHGQARLRLAFNLLMWGRDPQQASVHAQKAAHLLPDEPEAHFVLGLCYEGGGMEKAAVRALSRAVELKPNYTDAKKRLKKLKWGF